MKQPGKAMADRSNVRSINPVTALETNPWNLHTLQVDFREDQRWLGFLSSHPEGSVYHHPGYLAALEKEYGRRCIALACEGPDGKFQAILPLLSTQGLPWKIHRNHVGPRLSSLPRTPLGGPLANNRDALKAIVESAIALVQTGNGQQLEIKTMIDDLDQLVPSLHRCVWRDTYMRGLPSNRALEEDLCETPELLAACDGVCSKCRRLKFGNSSQNHKIKWAVEKALNLGVRVYAAEGDADLRKWYPLYLEVMRRNGVLPRPLRFFQALRRELGQADAFTLYLAEMPAERQKVLGSVHQTGPGSRITDKPLARLVNGSILLHYGHTTFWAFTGSSEHAMRSHANDLGLLECLRASCRQRSRSFDFGEVAENHPPLAQFKAKWGTIRKPIYRYYFPAPDDTTDAAIGGGSEFVRHISSLVWRHLPLPVIAVLGDRINSFL
jgi:hypothetical protein